MTKSSDISKPVRLPDEPPISGGETLNCSFCYRNREEVERMFAGHSVYICSDCVD